MLSVGRYVRIGVAAGLCGAMPSAAVAGDLKAPTIAASVAAAADWATTYHTLKHFRTREGNPLLRPLDDRPGRMITVGAAMDAGILSAWNLTVGRKNERVAAVGLWALAAFRGYLAIHNLRNQSTAARR
ncbi:MAG: hypothetical protein AB7P99_00285 [Vicinamibacterales bacterium]